VWVDVSNVNRESGWRLVTAVNAVSQSFFLHCNFNVHESFASKVVTCGGSNLRSYFYS